MAWILYGDTSVFPPYVLGSIAGIASGAAMLPYTIIKEANPPQFGGTAAGVVNFLNFTFSALLGPGVRRRSLLRVSGSAERLVTPALPAGFRAASLWSRDRCRADAVVERDWSTQCDEPTS